MKLITTILAVSFLAACAGPPKVRQVPADSVTPDSLVKSGKTNSKGYRCERYKPTGSHRVQKICYTEDQQDELARRTQDKLRSRNQPKVQQGDG